MFPVSSTISLPSQPASRSHSPLRQRIELHELKRQLTTSPTMAYFDPATNTEIIVNSEKHIL